MLAVSYDAAGSSSVIKVGHREKAKPGPGEVRIRVVRSGVNPTDARARRSGPGKFPEVTPGQDGAGYVDAVGARVTSLTVGDRVWVTLAQHGRAFGTAAEYTVQPATRVHRLPEEISFDLGASLGIPALTAHRMLTSMAEGPRRLLPRALRGRTVLVQGGAGAVGNAAIQLARWAGATVIATVSSAHKAALATAAGAHYVVNYSDADVPNSVLAIVPEGVDLVVEVAPAENAEVDVVVTKPHGTVACYSTTGGDILSVPIRAACNRNLNYTFMIIYSIDEVFLRNAVEDVSRAVAEHALQVGDQAGLPLHHFRLEDAAAAHAAVDRGVVGKVMLDVADDL